MPNRSKPAILGARRDDVGEVGAADEFADDFGRSD